jgi:hypothetical protein
VSLRRYRHTPPPPPQHTTETPVATVPIKPPAPRDAQWQVERIDTKPITAADYTRAVATLAILINQWQLAREIQNRTCKNAA